MLRPRWLSDGHEGEKKLAEILKEKFPKATAINVEDVSGKFPISLSLVAFHGAVSF